MPAITHDMVKALKGQTLLSTLEKVIRPSRRQRLKSAKPVTYFRYRFAGSLSRYHVDLAINNPQTMINHIVKWHADSDVHHFADGGLGLTVKLKLDIDKQGMIYASDIYAPIDWDNHIRL